MIEKEECIQDPNNNNFRESHTWKIYDDTDFIWICENCNICWWNVLAKPMGYNIDEPQYIKYRSTKEK